MRTGFLVGRLVVGAYYLFSGISGLTKLDARFWW